MDVRANRERRVVRLGALNEERYGAVLLEPPLDELPVPGAVLLEPMLPLLLEPMLPLDPEGLVAEFPLAAELSEPLTGPEGEVAPLLSEGAVALLLLSVEAPELGAVALFDPMLLELPEVLPLSWANTAGAKAATDSARPAPTK